MNIMSKLSESFMIITTIIIRLSITIIAFINRNKLQNGIKKSTTKRHKPNTSSDPAKPKEDLEQPASVNIVPKK
jgi:hypothetical protein